ncbi:HNH endonuclease signature motif containing protein [Aurantimonas sp. 22II-16-19i]|uniref:HNH endonuclease n=1 Tax=Aurantimonas sp. 22II-16-19i TaxID=1317114 RepID=UPI0009F7ACD2|nr:HNH endonuclease signature motif containing protein [Aurantimonas sp. 22II-16-19i]ORE88177.1 HNH nuclease [Aurantimonas sp. 22II-16-19i]
MGLRRYDRAGAAIYRSPRWKSVRFLAKRRDCWKCVQCGGNGRLEVDHVKPVRDAPELAFDLSNLQTLCGACHARKTRIEVGLAEIDPKRRAWRDLVRNAPQPQAPMEKPNA